MSWTAEEWKRVYGRGGAWTAVLIVAGLIGVDSVNWFAAPDGDPWFNTRTAAEIVAAAMERERIVVDSPATNWAPSVVVWSELASQSYTNVIDPVAQRTFFAHLNPALYMSGFSRRWIDLWKHEDDPMELFDGAAAFDPLAAQNDYMIGVDWWSKNIWGGNDGQWYPVTNSWVLTTNLLHAVGRSMTACRWTIESSLDLYGTETYEMVAGAQGASSDAWEDLFFDALVDMIGAWSATATPFETNGSVVLSHRGTMYWTQAAELDEHARSIVMIETVEAQSPPEPAVYMGNMTNAWGLGMLVPIESLGPLGFDMALSFYHKSRPQSTAIDVADCTAFDVDGVTRLRNDLAAWDGRFYIVPGAYSTGVVYPDHTTNWLAISGGKTFGWRFSETNQAVIIEWSLDHMNNHDAFWGTP